MTGSEDELTKEEIAWREHNLSQLRYFKLLSLRDKMLAIEGLAAIAERFEQMRREKKCRLADETPADRARSENLSM